MDVAARRVPAGSELHRALNRSLAECWTLGAKVARKSGQSSKAYNLLLEAEKYSREELFLERAKLGWDSLTQCCFRDYLGLWKWYYSIWKSRKCLELCGTVVFFMGLID